MKLHIGHGGHILEGWLNLEQNQCDITKPLAFKNDSVDFILIEHVLEHVYHHEGYKFLEEARRILKLGGVIRVIVPDMVKVSQRFTEEYSAMLSDGVKTWWPAVGREVTPNQILGYRDAVWSLLFCHGHKSSYTQEMLKLFMDVAGLKPRVCDYGKSIHPELNGVDSHWKYMGLENCILESCVVEGVK